MLAIKDVNVTENRHKYIGGSDIPIILGISKFKTAYELAKEKMRIVEKNYEDNEYTMYGNMLEPQIRDYINTVNNTHFVVETFVDDVANYRSNVDGIDKEHGTILEIKTHGKKPSKNVYYAQIQFYLYQTGLKHAWLAMYQRPDNFDAEFSADKLVIEEVERDDEYISKIIDSIETFRIRCEYLRATPTMSELEFNTCGTDIDKSLMKLNSITPQIELLKENIKQLETVEKNIKDELYKKMEENDVKKIETPFIVITRVLPTVSQSFDSKLFLEEHPEYDGQYIKKVTRKGYVKLTLKKGE